MHKHNLCALYVNLNTIQILCGRKDSGSKMRIQNLDRVVLAKFCLHGTGSKWIKTGLTLSLHGTISEPSLN